MRIWITALKIVVYGSLAGIIACGPKAANTAPEVARLAVFPLPPDSAKVQFLTRYAGSNDVVPEKKSSFFDRLVGEETTDTLEMILKPFGVDSYDGQIFICDTSLRDVVILGLRDSTYTRLKPTGAGALRTPVNCEVDASDGALYVADTGRGHVVVFDRDREFSKTIGMPDGLITDIAVDGGLLWATDKKLKQVHVFDSQTGDLVRSFPDPSEPDSVLLSFPVSIAVSSAEVFVVDQGLFEVFVYSREGDFVRRFGGHGDSPGHFTRPKGIAVSREGTVYVVDAAFQNVQMFDTEGNLLMYFGGPSTDPGYMYLPAQVEVEYDNLDLFSNFVDPRFRLDHLILVTNQIGPGKLSIYGRVEQIAPAND